jgi:hypothetical protein
MGSSKVGKLLLLMICSCFFAGAIFADEVKTELSKDKIGMGDTFTLLFTINGRPSSATPDFNVLQKDFAILDTNYGNSVEMINGVTTVQTFWRLTLSPRQMGTLTIPAISFGDDKSLARQITVTDAAVATLSDVKEAPIFITAQVSNTKPYVQSQVLYTFKLYFQSQLENPRLEIPQVKDATMVQLADGSQYQTKVNGKDYMVVEKNIAIFPQKSGSIIVPAAFLRTMADVGSPVMRNDPFYMPSLQSLTFATKTLTLNVQKIPDTFQGTTWLPAKNITLTETWSTPSDQWEAGNPVTRTITLTAEGLRADQLPDLTLDKIGGVNMYIDPPQRSNDLKNNVVIGTLEQKVTYIPNLTQPFTLPAVKVNWWNLQTNTNAVAKLVAQTIQVAGKMTTTSSHPANSPAAATVTTAKPKANITTDKFYLSVWFWISVFLLLSWLTSLWLRKRPEKKAESAPKAVSATPALEFDPKSFALACKQGNPVMAQQFLLAWAKKQWPATPMNLEKLRHLSNNAEFTIALENLAQVLYAKNVTAWQGQDLLTAFNALKKQSEQLKPVTKLEPLPPLNPGD